MKVVAEILFGIGMGILIGRFVAGWIDSYYRKDDE